MMRTGGLAVFHRADLHAGGVGAEEFAGIEVERVLFVAGRVVGGGVEGVEAVEFVFDFRAVGEGEAHAAEDADGLVADLGERVERAGGEGAGGQGDVDAGEGGAVGGGWRAACFSSRAAARRSWRVRVRGLWRLWLAC
jgi:hypothetical protein